MFKITKDEVTIWCSGQGYGKGRPSTAWRAFVDDRGGDCDECLARAGYAVVTRAVSSHETDWLYDILLYEHTLTGELIVFLDGGDGWMSGLFVDQESADAFMFTEYLEIVDRVGRITSHERQRVAHRAQMAFIRHGHGQNVVDRDGRAGEDLDDERKRLNRSRPET